MFLAVLDSYLGLAPLKWYFIFSFLSLFVSFVLTIVARIKNWKGIVFFDYFFALSAVVVIAVVVVACNMIFL